MSRSVNAYLADIIEACDAINEVLSGIGFEAGLRVYAGATAGSIE